VFIFPAIPGALLATPYARRITGSTVYVDAGLNIMALGGGIATVGGLGTRLGQTLCLAYARRMAPDPALTLNF
jgi:hypothetical protein